MTLTFADPTPDSRSLHIVTPDDLEAWRGTLDARSAAWVSANDFMANAGETLQLPSDDGTIGAAVVGTGGAKDRARKRFVTANARAALAKGSWRIGHVSAGVDMDEVALGWLLAGDRFDRYATAKRPAAELVAPDGIDAARIEAIAAGEALTRALINTPASDMGPADLEDATRQLAAEFGGSVDVITGDGLLDANLPMIHAVGRASPRRPRLIDLRWGSGDRRLTLVGKGVCFDTGGLNLKPGGSMALMKKDMGGAANVLGLTRMLMQTGAEISLRVLIPAVENSVGGSAFRPGDILTSRKGLTVEINNTDAEGRLVLADALALADEEGPDLVISMATLTGAARVAVGPDLAPYYAQSDADAATLEAAATEVRDPVWRLPFWDPYEAMIEPGIADLDNSPSGGFAGSITAALFLRRFVTETPRYLHFDVYGWQPSAAPARPKGGVGQATRALLHAMPELLR